MPSKYQGVLGKVWPAMERWLGRACHWRLPAVAKMSQDGLSVLSG
jgi:hypothetical protein